MRWWHSATPPPSPPPSSPSCGARTPGSVACSVWAPDSRAATCRPRCCTSRSRSALTFIVSAGKKQGVKPLSAVLSPEGLVGIVSSVDAKTSVVVSWAHPEFRASAMAADGSVYGIVAPHGSDGPRIWLLELQGVAYRQLVPTGTMILTSGLGGVLPRGVPIGTVVGVAGEAEGWERAYLIRPAVHPAAVTHVMILTGPPVRGDLRALFESSGETP